MDKGVKKVINFLKNQKLLAVPFDKGCDFCVLEETTYWFQLNDILSASQVEARSGEIYDLTKNLRN